MNLLTANWVILVDGLPCTGKTYVGRHLAKHFSLPFLNKDGIKERLFDSLGWSDRLWSKQLSAASYLLLFHFAEALMQARKPFIMESNFSAALHTPVLRALQQTYGFRVLEIQCVAEGQVLVERFRQRWESGERHPGHVDQETMAELHPTLLLGRLQPLGLEGSYLEIDMTDFNQAEVSDLFQQVAQAIK